MTHKAKILITGGAGFIGSHINKLLNLKGYATVVIDDLSRGKRIDSPYGTFVQGSLETDLKKIFKEHKFDAVIHLAAYIRVGESTQNPLLYYKNNVAGTIALLDAMRENQVNTLVFSSTAAIFGIPQTERIAEGHPKKPINPYGRSKLMIEEILEDCERAYGLRSCSLRYFNAAGGDPDGELQNGNSAPQNLIPIALEKHALTLFGRDYETPDGTCIRDYIHVWDLARAHLLALEKILSGASSCQYNLGNGNGASVQEVIDTINRITNTPLTITNGPRRPGDPPRLIADPTLANKELHWRPQYDLDAIVQHAHTCGAALHTSG